MKRCRVEVMKESCNVSTPHDNKQPNSNTHLRDKAHECVAERGHHTILSQHTIRVKVRISLDVVLAIQPRNDFAQERLLLIGAAVGAKLSDPELASARGVTHIADVLLEASHVGGSVIPVHGHEIDSAAGASLHEGFQVSDTHWCGSVRDSGGSELGLASEGLHEGLVTCGGGTGVEVSLRGQIGLVKGEEMLASLRNGGGGGLVPAVGVNRLGSPEHRHVLERRWDGGSAGSPVVGPGDLGVRGREAVGKVRIVVGKATLVTVGGWGSDGDRGWCVDWRNGGWDIGRNHGGDEALDAAEDVSGLLGRVGSCGGGYVGRGGGSVRSSGRGCRSCGSCGSDWCNRSDWDDGRRSSGRSWRLRVNSRCNIGLDRIGSIGSLGVHLSGARGRGRGGDEAGAVPPDSHPIGDGVDHRNISLGEDSITLCGVKVKMPLVRHSQDTAGQQRGRENDCRK